MVYSIYSVLSHSFMQIAFWLQPLPSGGGGAAAPAGAPPGAAAAPAGPGLLGNVGLIVAMIAFFYFVVLRPQQKQREQAETLLKSLQKGDKVLTNSGMYGTVVAIDGDDATLEISEKVRVKFKRAAIAERLNGLGATDAKSKKDAPAKDAPPTEAK
jgi:preprotein translocase subunit YajC